MALFITAHYKVKPKAVSKVARAVKEFTEYVRKNEPGTQMYLAWQDKKHPNEFVHFFIFKNGNAQITHSKSAAVKKFESIYSPELIGGTVVFTHYDLVATNQKKRF